MDVSETLLVFGLGKTRFRKQIKLFSDDPETRLQTVGALGSWIIGDRGLRSLKFARRLHQKDCESQEGEQTYIP